MVSRLGREEAGAGKRGGGGCKITDPFGDGNIQFDGIVYPCQAIVLQDVIICGNWVKGKWDFSVFILNN